MGGLLIVIYDDIVLIKLWIQRLAFRGLWYSAAAKYVKTKLLRNNWLRTILEACFYHQHHAPQVQKWLAFYTRTIFLWHRRFPPNYYSSLQTLHHRRCWWLWNKHRSKLFCCLCVAQKWRLSFSHMWNCKWIQQIKRARRGIVRPWRQTVLNDELRRTCLFSQTFYFCWKVCKS